jgi:hypothetical protein
MYSVRNVHASRCVYAAQCDVFGHTQGLQNIVFVIFAQCTVYVMHMPHGVYTPPSVMCMDMHRVFKILTF